MVKEAASLHKHNLFQESSRASLSSVSTPSSPAPALASSVRFPSQTPPSPLAANGLPPSPTKGAEPKREKVGEEVLQAADWPDAKLPAGEGTQNDRMLKVEGISSADPKPPSAETLDPSEPQIQENLSVQAEEPRTQRTDQQEAETTSSEPPAVSPEPPADPPEVPTAAEPPAPEPSSPEPLGTVEPPAPEPSVVSEAPTLDQTDEPVNLPAEEPGSQAAAASQQPSAMLAAPPGGEEAEDVGLKLQLKTEDAEGGTASDPNSLAVSVGSDSPRSDPESTGGISETSELLEVQSALSPEETSEDQTSAGEPSIEAQTGEVEAGAGATAESPAEPDGAAFSPPAGNGPGEPDVQPLDCVKEIRNLVVEVIEVEEPMDRFPKEE